MKVLLDENLPEGLVGVLRRLGHDVDSVNSLRMKGLDNGTLYREVAQGYDLCFTRDFGFARGMNQVRGARVKLLRVILPQTPAKMFVVTFVATFTQTDWTKYKNGDEWP